MKTKIFILISLFLILLTSCHKQGGSSQWKLGVAMETPEVKVVQLTNRNDGSATFLTHYAAVVIDQEDRLVKVVYDKAETKIGVDVIGRVKLPVATVTNKEKKDAYGMKKQSTIGSEWYQQVKSLENFLVGKTRQELEQLTYLESGALDDVDTKSSATISAKPMVDLILKAWDQAKDLDREVTSLGTYLSSQPQTQKAATTQEEGLVQVVDTLAVVAMDANKFLIQVVLDQEANQATYSIEGKVEAHPILPSKKTQKDKVGLKEESSIHKEWFEQVEFLETYLKDKTQADVEGLILDDEGKATHGDVASGATLPLDQFQKNIITAMQRSTAIKP